jgi:hypothetical protein
VKTNGPGKYDDIATQARESTNATAVVLVVYNGDKGSGFSVQSESDDWIRILPDILEAMAKQIREDLKATRQ